MVVDVNDTDAHDFQSSLVLSCTTRPEVTYKVTDSQGASVTKTISVTVKAKDILKPTPDRNNNPSADKNKNSKASNTAKTTSNHVKTGDTTNVTFWALLAFLSCGLFVLIIRTKKKNAIKK